MEQDQQEESFARNVERRIRETMAAAKGWRIVVSKESGERLFDVPLAAGIAVGGAVTLIAPVVTGLAALGLVVTGARIRVVTED